MKVGICGYGAFIPWRRLSRAAVVDANAWFAPELKARRSGHRSMANWDEDSITMAVAAARDLLGDSIDRKTISQLWLASTTLPFADRLNAGVAAAALNLEEEIAALDVTGAQTSTLAALSQCLASASAKGGNVLLTAADNRVTRAASVQELVYGDGAAAIMLGSGDVLAELVSEASLTVDFVDHFRQSNRDVDYQWEERWIRDEGIAKLMPKVIQRSLQGTGLNAADIDHFIFPSVFAKVDAQIARQCGIRSEAVAGNLAETVGDTGSAHALLMLAHVLENARPGQIIMLTQFGFGAHALVFRVTDAIAGFSPKRGVTGWLNRRVEEKNYTRFLAYKNQLVLERGMRGEQDKKTALTTAYRYRHAILGLIAGRCSKTGDVHFPPSRLSYSRDGAALDTQEPYPLADKKGRVLSWSAESLSSYMAPPHQYGQVDFIGGGRLLSEFTDVEKGDIETGCEVEMVFRIKDVDESRGFKRYFWKATPTQRVASRGGEE